MRILLIEDTLDVSIWLRPILEMNGYAIDTVANFGNAEHFLTKDPGHGYYSAVILDLSMSGHDLPEDVAYLINEGYFAGWLFYNHIICKHTGLSDKTIFCSAFINDLRRSIDEEAFEKLNVLDKNGRDFFEKLFEKLREFDIK